MKVLAGIDGGGTRTRLALAREDGTLLSWAEKGSCSFVEQGMERAQQVLKDLWQEAWQKSSLPEQAADALFMGTGSILAAKDAQVNCELLELLGMVRPGRVRAENDAFNALAGGLCGRPGILLISGTGSACLGRNREGRSWRAGGWGCRLNDAGSAHALGLAAMVAATRDADGRGPATRLTSMVLEKLGIPEMTEIFRRVHQQELDRTDIAAMAPQVVALADEGDEVARKILDDQAQGLVEMVVTVARHLNLSNPELALTGGLITHAARFRTLFLEQLNVALPGFTTAAGGYPPVLGSLILAAELLSGNAPSEDFLHNLRLSSTSFPKLES